MKRVAVIGGGFTGMAAAWELRAGGVEVVLFEKNPSLGGLAGGFREPEWDSSLEYFYHHWFKSDAELKRFARLWGAERELVFRYPATVTETSAGSFVRLDSPWALLRYPGLSLFSKLRMGAALAYLRFTNSWKPLERHTAREWCQRMMGHAGFTEIWEPLLRGKFGEAWASRVNMAWFWSRLKTRTAALGTFKGGFQRFIERGEAALCACGVQVVKSVAQLQVLPCAAGPEQPRWKVTGAPAGVPQEFHDVIVCASPAALSGLVPLARDWVRASCKDRVALGAQVIIFSLDRRLGKPGVYWYSLRKSPAFPFLAAVEHTEFVPSAEFAGEHLLYLADYVDTAAPDWLRTDADLMRLGSALLRKINPEFNDTWIKRHWVFREAYAQPVVGVNASQTLPPLLVPVHEGLYHASMGHIYPYDRGTNFALELGRHAAGACLERREVTFG